MSFLVLRKELGNITSGSQALSLSEIIAERQVWDLVAGHLVTTAIYRELRLDRNVRAMGC